jgi:hypothetical protein
VNARSTDALANVDVKLESNSGIRCEQAPCPSTVVDWSGRSSATGDIVVPRRALKASTIVSVPKAWAQIVERAEKHPSGTWTVELDPEPDKTYPIVYGLQLVQKRTGERLANRSVGIELPRGQTVTAHSNSLGYVYFQVPGLAYDGDYVVRIAGYKPVTIPGGWKQHIKAAFDKE